LKERVEVAKKTKQKGGEKSSTPKAKRSSVKKTKAASSAKTKKGKSRSSNPSKIPSPKKSKSQDSSEAKVVLRPRSQLTSEELIHFRQLLLEKMKELVGDVHWFEDEGMRGSRLDAAGDLSAMPIHMADIGTDIYEQEFSLGLMDSKHVLVREILDALRRIEEGVYGICEGTGKPISKGRLEANPWARYCVEYACRIEGGKASGQQRAEQVLFFDEQQGEGRQKEGEKPAPDEVEKMEEIELSSEEMDADDTLEEEDLEEEDDSFF